MTAKKILTVIPFPFLPPKAGGEWCAYYSTEFLAKHRPSVVASTGNNSLYPSTFTLYRPFSDAKSKYLLPRTFGALDRLAKRHSLKGVFLHQPFMGYWAYKLARKHQVPLMVYVHNLEFERFRSMGKPWWPLMKRLESWLYRRADYLLFISDIERERAIEYWNLRPERCFYVPSGVLHEEGFSEDIPTFLFFGSMRYTPNEQAVALLLEKVAPAWEALGYGKARWVICGGGLSEGLQTEIWETPGFKYMGFVDPLSAYLQAADVMVNPVLTGGGVKTKVVEALSWGLTVVSTEEGLQGLDRSSCGEKLIAVPNQDWQAFAQKLKQALPKSREATPKAFYEQYHWKNSMGKVAETVFPAEGW